MWENVRDLFEGYMGSGLLWCFFLMVLLFLFFYEEDKVKRIMFIYSPIAFLLLFFNPIFMEVLCGVIGEQIYYRILWLVPVALIIGYAFVQVYRLLKGKKRICFLAVGVCVIIATGRPIYASKQYSVAENLYHVPEEVVVICEAIEIEGREVMAVFPIELVQYVRQYSPYVCMPYGREVLVDKWRDFSDLYDAINAEIINVAEVTRLSKQEGCHYIIVDSRKEPEGEFADYGYESVLRAGVYEVYRDVTFVQSF